MKKFIFLITIILTGTFFGQDINQDITPISPQAASFTKYVETPVSHFNGTTGINIPIYNINDGSLNVPITLGYHSGGIKVNEEASWVGLGWSLTAGGQITHIVKGRDDLGSHDFKNRVFPSPFGAVDTAPFPVNFYLANFYNEDGEIENFFDTIWANQNRFDGEADYYAYSFGGYSGKFLVDNGEIYDITGNSILFEFTNTAITATTPEGIVYFFDVIERSYSDEGGFSISTYFLSEISTPLEPDNRITFSYKSFQEVRNGFQAIFIGLPQNSLPPQLPQATEQYINSNATVSNPSGFKKNYSKFQMDERYLDRIDFRNGYVTFEKGPRDDKYGFALTRLKVFAKDNNSPVKDIVFNLGTFNGYRQYGGDYLEDKDDDYYPIAYRKDRLKLNGITDYTDPREPKEHDFSYYEDLQLPYKTSHAADYWGYFNDAYGNRSLIPDYRRYVSRSKIPSTLSNWRGADREPDQENAIAGTLRSITYPTKGTSEFEYELHTYTNLKETGLPDGTVYVPTSASAVDYNEGGVAGYVQKEFEIVAPPNGNDIPPVDISVGLFCNSDILCPANCGTGGSSDANRQYADLYKLNQSTNQWVLMVENSWDGGDVQIYDCNDGNPRMHDYSRRLPEGKYRIRVNYPDNLQGSHNGRNKHSRMSVRYYHLVDENEAQNLENGVGGGIRIAKITNTATDTNSTTEKTYEYQDGIMTRYPVFYYYENKFVHRTVPNPNCPSCVYLDQCAFSYLYSTPVYPFSYSANGSLVGYKKVKEFNKKTDDYNDSQGEIHYEYYVEPDSFFEQSDQVINSPNTNYQGIVTAATLAGTPSIPNLKNGKLKTLTYYYGDTIGGGLTGPFQKRQEYVYDILEERAFWNLKIREQFHNFNFGSGIIAGSDQRLLYWRYTLFPVLLGKVVPVKEIITENDFSRDVYPPVYRLYGQEINTHYDSDEHLFPTKTEHKPNDSNGEVYSTIMVYPQDYNGGSTMIRDLVDANKVNQPIETVTYVEKDQEEMVTSATINTAHNKTVQGFGKLKESLSFEKNERVALSEFKFSNVPTAGNNPHGNGTRSNFSLSLIDPHYDDIPVQTLSYNSNGNIQQIGIRQEKDAVIVWGYNENYVIAKIENAIYVNLNNSQLRAIALATEASNNDNSVANENILKDRLKNLQQEFPESMVSTYTYDPLIGITSMTDPRGYTMTYHYDRYNRLEFVKDADNNLVSENKYNYKN